MHTKLPLDAFEGWWESDGRYIDPDTSDVDWYDKRKELAGIAFNAGHSQAERAVELLREYHDAEVALDNLSDYGPHIADCETCAFLAEQPGGGK